MKVSRILKLCSFSLVGLAIFNSSYNSNAKKLCAQNPRIYFVSPYNPTQVRIYNLDRHGALTEQPPLIVPNPAQVAPTVNRPQGNAQVIPTVNRPQGNAQVTPTFNRPQGSAPPRIMFRRTLSGDLVPVIA